VTQKPESFEMSNHVRQIWLHILEKVYFEIIQFEKEMTTCGFNLRDVIGDYCGRLPDVQNVNE
jgi:hypothetical protein